MFKCNENTNLNEAIEIFKISGENIVCTSEQAIEISELTGLNMVCCGEREKELIQNVNSNLKVFAFDENFKNIPHIKIKVNKLLKHLFGENTFEIEMIL